MSKLLAGAVALYSLALAPTAHAYLDPGTGSAIIQMLVASVMGALFFAKLYWRKLVSFFSSSDGSGAGESTNPTESTNRVHEGQRAAVSPTNDTRD